MLCIVGGVDDINLMLPSKEVDASSTAVLLIVTFLARERTIAPRFWRTKHYSGNGPAEIQRARRTVYQDSHKLCGRVSSGTSLPQQMSYDDAFLLLTFTRHTMKMLFPVPKMTRRCRLEGLLSTIGSVSVISGNPKAG